MNYIELVADESGGYTGHIKCAEAFFQLGLKRWIWSLEKKKYFKFSSGFQPIQVFAPSLDDRKGKKL